MRRFYFIFVLFIKMMFQSVILIERMLTSKFVTRSYIWLMFRCSIPFNTSLEYAYGTFIKMISVFLFYLSGNKLEAINPIGQHLSLFAENC